MYGILIQFIGSGIEVVITGLTRNFLKSWLFAPLKKPVKSGVFSGSKIKYFVVLSVSSFQKFLEEMRNYIHGELSEWSKVQHSKFYGDLVVSSAGNPFILRVFIIKNRIFFSVLSCFSLQKIFELKADGNIHGGLSKWS